MDEMPLAPVPGGNHSDYLTALIRLQLSLSDFDLERRLGEGSYAQVYPSDLTIDMTYHQLCSLQGVIQLPCYSGSPSQTEGDRPALCSQSGRQEFGAKEQMHRVHQDRAQTLRQARQPMGRQASLHIPGPVQPVLCPGTVPKW